MIIRGCSFSTMHLFKDDGNNNVFCYFPALIKRHGNVQVYLQGEFVSEERLYALEVCMNKLSVRPGSVLYLLTRSWLLNTFSLYWRTFRSYSPSFISSNPFFSLKYHLR